MTSQVANPAIFVTKFGIQASSAISKQTHYYPLSVYDIQWSEYSPIARIGDGGSLIACLDVAGARRIFAKALVNLGSYITIQGSDGSVLAQISPNLSRMCSASLSRDAHSFICLACYEAEQMRKANLFSPDVPTNSALEQAPKCECGGRSMGARDYQPGHSDWCDVSHTKGK